MYYYAGQANSVSRLRTIMGMPTSETDEVKIQTLRRSRYGLGDRRTLQQAVDFTGIDTIHGTILSNRCGNIEYVPFIEHPQGADYIPQFDSLTEAFTGEYDEGSIYHPSHNQLTLKANNTHTHNKIRTHVKEQIASAANIALSEVYIGSSSSSSSSSAFISWTLPCIIVIAIVIILMLIRKYCNIHC